MADFPSTAVDYLDLGQIYEVGASLGPAQVEYIDFGSGDATNPVVSNVTPTPGTAITPDTGIAFEITDLGGNLNRTNVSAYYPSLQRWEVLYYSEISGAWGTRPEGFGPQYEGTRTPIPNGFAFTGVKRRGGWPARPVLVVDPTDTDGNEAS